MADIQFDFDLILNKSKFDRQIKKIKTDLKNKLSSEINLNLGSKVNIKGLNTQISKLSSAIDKLGNLPALQEFSKSVDELKSIRVDSPTTVAYGGLGSRPADTEGISKLQRDLDRAKQSRNDLLKGGLSSNEDYTNFTKKFQDTIKARKKLSDAIKNTSKSIDDSSKSFK